MMLPARLLKEIQDEYEAEGGQVVVTPEMEVKILKAWLSVVLAMAPSGVSGMIMTGFLNYIKHILKKHGREDLAEVIT